MNLKIKFPIFFFNHWGIDFFFAICISTKLSGKTKISEEHLTYEKALPKSEIKANLRGCHVCRNSTINNF